MPQLVVFLSMPQVVAVFNKFLSKEGCFKQPSLRMFSFCLVGCRFAKSFSFISEERRAKEKGWLTTEGPRIYTFFMHLAHQMARQRASKHLRSCTSK